MGNVCSSCGYQAPPYPYPPDEIFWSDPDPLPVVNPISPEPETVQPPAETGLAVVSSPKKAPDLTDLESTLGSIVGTDWADRFPQENVALLRTYQELFSPSGYTLLPVTTRNDNEVRLGWPNEPFSLSDPDFLQGLPCLQKMVFFQPNGECDEVHGAELCVPFRDSEDKEWVLLLKGSIEQDRLVEAVEGLSRVQQTSL